MFPAVSHVVLAQIICWSLTFHSVAVPAGVTAFGHDAAHENQQLQDDSESRVFSWFLFGKGSQSGVQLRP